MKKFTYYRPSNANILSLTQLQEPWEGIYNNIHKNYNGKLRY